MNSMMLLENLNLRDNPGNVKITLLPSHHLSKIDCLITNNRKTPINLSVIGTVLVPDNPNYNKLIICSVLNNRYPESIIIKSNQSIKTSFATTLLENKEFLPNHLIKYSISNEIHEKIIKLIKRHLIARRKVIRARTKEVHFKHGEKSYFKLTHLFDSIKKYMKGA